MHLLPPLGIDLRPVCIEPSRFVKKYPHGFVPPPHGRSVQPDPVQTHGREQADVKKNKRHPYLHVELGSVPFSAITPCFWGRDD